MDNATGKPDRGPKGSLVSSSDAAGSRGPANRITLASAGRAAAGRAAAGRAADGAHAAAHAAAGQGYLCFNNGQFPTAVEHYARAVQLYPTDATYHFGLAAAAERAGERLLVKRHLLEAVRLNPAYATAHHGLAEVYRGAGDFETAVRHSEAALHANPQSLDYLVSHAASLTTVGKENEAWALIAPLIDAGVTHPMLGKVYADVAPAIGHVQRASVVVEWLLWATEAGGDLKSMLHFSAAQLLDRLGAYDDAFAQARTGNALVRRAFDPDANAKRTSWRIEHLTAGRMKSLPRATHGDRRPVFIVGMPRSGTSLVEQILASHPAVFGAGERRDLGRVALDASNGLAAGDRFDAWLDALSVRELNRMAGEYRAATAPPEAASSAKWVTDKMPANAEFLHLVELMFPDARVINCVRNPLDVCLSCYFTHFAVGNEFTFDLGHLGAYCRDHTRLMDHWKSALSLPILDVRYEDLVIDPDPQMRRLLAFLDLPWDDRCANFHDSPRVTRTASNLQVRRPIYTSSIGRWKCYENHLSPLIAALRGHAA